MALEGADMTVVAWRLVGKRENQADGVLGMEWLVCHSHCGNPRVVKQDAARQGWLGSYEFLPLACS